MDNIVATIKPWNIQNYYKIFQEDTENSWCLVTDHKLLSGTAKTLNPRYIFFPHWSWIIPKEVYENYECIAFHMTNLPFGRGAEPLQHLISRGITETQISAFRVFEGIDTGPIYLKRPLNLNGSAEEIYMRCSNIIFFDMIPYIIEKKPSPILQIGESVEFTKRTLEDCRIPDTNDLSKVYDVIRMNDAETYPKAFIETDKIRLEFSRASLKHDSITAEVKIIERNK